MSLSAAVKSQFAKQTYLGELSEVYVISQRKKLRSHLLAFGRRQVRSAPPSDSWALVNTPTQSK